VVIGDQGSFNGRADHPVVPDHRVEGEQSLNDACPQARRDPAAVPFQAELVLRGSHTLRGFDRLPAEVELTNPRHPLAGRRVPVMSAYRRNGGVWLVVMLPDGFPAPVRVGDTDLGGPGVAATGTTILSVAGIRRLRELAAGVAAKDRDQ